MIAIAAVIAFCLAFIAFALWADKTGFDPFARLYGTDPRELVARAQAPRITHRAACPIEFGYNACTCPRVEAS